MQAFQACEGEEESRRGDFLCDASRVPAKSIPLARETQGSGEPRKKHFACFSAAFATGAGGASLFTSASAPQGDGAYVGHETRRSRLGRLAERAGDEGDSSSVEETTSGAAPAQVLDSREFASSLGGRRFFAKSSDSSSSMSSTPSARQPRRSGGAAAREKRRWLKDSSSPSDSFREGAAAAVAASKTGAPRRGESLACAPLVGEMASLFRNAALAQQRRAAAAYREAVFKDAQILSQLSALHRRLCTSMRTACARGSLVKARSLQLQQKMYEATRPQAPANKLPPQLALPLPALRGGEGASASRAEDSVLGRLVRQLQRRWRQRRRRASLPPLRSVFRAALAKGGAAAARSSSPSSASKARLPPSASAAQLLIDDLEQSLALRRSASEDALLLRRGGGLCALGRGCFARVHSAKLREMAEGVLERAPAAAVSASQSEAGRLLQRVGSFAQLLRVCVELSHGRMQLAEELQQRRPRRKALLRAVPAPPSRSSPPQPWMSEGKGGEIAAWEFSREFSSKGLEVVRGAAKADGDGDSQPLLREESTRGQSAFASDRELAEALSSSDSWRPQRPSSREVSTWFSSSLAEEVAPSPPEAAVIGAEAECEALLGRELLPYERLLLRLQFLREAEKSQGGTGAAAVACEAACASLIEQVLDEDDAFPSQLLAEAEFAAQSSQRQSLCAPHQTRRWSEADETPGEEQLESLLNWVEELRNHQVPSPPDSAAEAPLSLEGFFSQGESERVSVEEQALRAFFNETPSADAFSSAEVGDRAEVGGSVSTSEAAAGAPAKAASPPAPSVESRGAFPSGKHLYRAHYVVGPWRSSLFLAADLQASAKKPTQ